MRGNKRALVSFTALSRSIIGLLIGGFGRAVLLVSLFACGLLLLDAVFSGLEWAFTYDDRLLTEAADFALKATILFAATALAHLWREKLRQDRKVEPWATWEHRRSLITIGCATSDRDNRFDSIKILAAIAVLLSNAFPIAHGSIAAQPLATLSYGQTTLSGFAVLTLSAISGYLITQSFDQSPLPLHFLKARILRMFPALAFVLILSAGILGLAVTSLSSEQYLTNFDTSQYLYGGLSLIWMQYDLPGVFENNPAGPIVNGSLWTLPCEFILYLVVLILGMSGLLNRRFSLALWLGALILNWYAVGGAYGAVTTTFLGGATFYLWRDLVALDWFAALLCALTLGLATITEGFHLAFAIFGVYLVIYLAFIPTFRRLNLARWGNLSYGIYIFSWPVQQTVAFLLGSRMTWYWNVALSLPTVLVLAWLSWHLVEKPALLLSRRRATA